MLIVYISIVQHVSIHLPQMRISVECALCERFNMNQLVAMGEFGSIFGVIGFPDYKNALCLLH